MARKVRIPVREAARRANDRKHFTHLPLDTEKKELRLICVSPDLDSDGRIQCSLDRYDLDCENRKRRRFSLKSRKDKKCPPYVAISYTWGSTLSQYPIMINGCSFTVSENLHRFLEVQQRKAKATEPLFLWIDQISIDQENVSERNHQVQQMADIYSRAVEVWAWVGPSDEASDLAIGRLKTYAHARQQGAHVSFKIDNDILTFFNRPWWSRTWVLQEVYLGKRISLLCGDLSLEWNDILYSIRVWPDRPGSGVRALLLKLKSMGVDLSAPPETAAYDKLVEAGRLDLGRALRDFFDAHCEDPRDRVYGLMGIVKTSQQLAVDYCKTPLQVYLDAINEFSKLQTTGTLFISGLDQDSEFCSDLLYALGHMMGVIPEWTLTGRPLFCTWLLTPLNEGDRRLRQGIAEKELADFLSELQLAESTARSDSGWNNQWFQASGNQAALPTITTEAAG